jgi:hypothetical protein
MVDYGNLREWSAEGLVTASSTLRSDVKTLERARDAVDDEAVPSSWLGLASLFAKIRKLALVGTMDEHLEGVRRFERAIYQASGPVRAITTVVTDLDHDARSQGFEISHAGSVTDVAPPRTFESATAADAYTQERTGLRDALVARVEAVLDQAYDVDSTLVHARPDGSFSSDGPQGVADPEVARRWSEMTDEERRAALEDMAEELAEAGGVEDFEIRFEDLEDADGDGVDDNPETDAHGSWSEDDRVLRLDTNDLDDPDLINTVAHEVRHAVQHQAVDDLPDDADDPFDPPPGATRDDVEDWRDNFDDYISPEDDFDGYHDQPVESDARDTGDDYLDDLTEDDLEGHRKEGG